MIQIYSGKFSFSHSLQRDFCLDQLRLEQITRLRLVIYSCQLISKKISLTNKISYQNKIYPSKFEPLTRQLPNTIRRSSFWRRQAPSTSDVTEFHKTTISDKSRIFHENFFPRFTNATKKHTSGSDFSNLTLKSTGRKGRFRLAYPFRCNLQSSA